MGQGQGRRLSAYDRGTPRDGDPYDHVVSKNQSNAFAQPNHRESEPRSGPYRTSELIGQVPGIEHHGCASEPGDDGADRRADTDVDEVDDTRLLGERGRAPGRKPFASRGRGQFGRRRPDAVRTAAVREEPRSPNVQRPTATSAQWRRTDDYASTSTVWVIPGEREASPIELEVRGHGLGISALVPSWVSWASRSYDCSSRAAANCNSRLSCSAFARIAAEAEGARRLEEATVTRHDAWHPDASSLDGRQPQVLVRVRGSHEPFRRADTTVPHLVIHIPRDLDALDPTLLDHSLERGPQGTFTHQGQRPSVGIEPSASVSFDEDLKSLVRDPSADEYETSPSGRVDGTHRHVGHHRKLPARWPSASGLPGVPDEVGVV